MCQQFLLYWLYETLLCPNGSSEGKVLELSVTNSMTTQCGWDLEIAVGEAIRHWSYAARLSLNQCILSMRHIISNSKTANTVIEL